MFIVSCTFVSVLGNSNRSGGLLFRIFLQAFVLCSLSILSLGLTKKTNSQYEVFEHIVLSQDITVSAHRLCQDGLFIYFKNRQECERTPIPFICDGDLRVVPIRSVEKIYLEQGGPDVTRFYEVQTDYSYESYLKKENGDDVLLKKETKTIPMCEDRELYEPENVGEWRYVESKEELEILESLLVAGHKLINTPFGSLERIRNLDLDHLKKPKERRVQVNTPFCNKTVPTAMVWQMSGEHTGNGVMDFNVGGLQSLSKPMYIERERKVWDPKTQQTRIVYDLTCQPTWDI